MFRIIPLLMRGRTGSEFISVAKYFFVQVLGSIIIVGGGIAEMVFFGRVYVDGSLIRRGCMIIVIVGIIIKVGLFPFHFWVPGVMAGLSWDACFLVSTLQKVVPLYIMVYECPSYLGGVVVILGCIRSFVGGVGGFRQTQIRRLLAYSSISHTGWLLVGGVYRPVGAVIYFCLYRIITGVLIYHLSAVEINSYEFSLKGFRRVRVNKLLVLRVLMLTLGGLPPTLGFSIKWVVVCRVASFSPFYAFVLVFGSFVNLCYYVRVVVYWFRYSYSRVWEVVIRGKEGSVGGFILYLVRVRVLFGFLRFLGLRIFVV